MAESAAHPCFGLDKQAEQLRTREMHVVGQEMSVVAIRSSHLQQDCRPFVFWFGKDFGDGRLSWFAKVDAEGLFLFASGFGSIYAFVCGKGVENSVCGLHPSADD